MSATARVTVNPGAVSMAASVRTAARAAPLLVLTGRAFLDLVAELGSMDAAALHLLDVAESVGRPIGANLPLGDGSSRTAFIAPRSWTEQRLGGWIGARHVELEAQFGEVVRFGSEFPAPGGGA